MFNPLPSLSHFWDLCSLKLQIIWNQGEPLSTGDCIGQSWSPFLSSEFLSYQCKNARLIAVIVSRLFMANVWQRPNAAATQNLQWIKLRTSGWGDLSVRILVYKAKKKKIKNPSFEIAVEYPQTEFCLPVYQLFVNKRSPTLTLFTTAVLGGT